VSLRTVFEATVTAWNPDTGANTVHVDTGQIVTNLPVLVNVAPRMAAGVRVLITREYAPDGSRRSVVVNGHPFVIIATISAVQGD
jgi:hypothetical protein